MIVPAVYRVKSSLGYHRGMETRVYRIFDVPMVPSLGDDAYRAVAQSEASMVGPPTDPLEWIAFWDEWVALGTRCAGAFLLAAAGTRWNLRHTPPDAPMLYTPTHALIALFAEALPLVQGAGKLTALDIVDEVHATRPPEVARLLESLAQTYMGEYARYTVFPRGDNPAVAARLLRPYRALQTLARQLPSTMPLSVQQELFIDAEEVTL